MKKTVLCISLVLLLLLHSVAFVACDGGGSSEGVHAVHAYGPWSVTKAATCTETGERERTCSCGDKQTETIPALGHNFVNGICTECGAHE